MFGKLPFLALFLFLCLVAGPCGFAAAQDRIRPPSAHVLDGDWRRIGGEERASVDMGAGQVVFQGRKFRFDQVITAQPQQGPVWLVRSGPYRLRVQLLDGVLLEVLFLEEEYVMYLVPAGFTPPQEPPAGIWVWEQDGRFSTYDLDADWLSAGRWANPEEPGEPSRSYEETASWELVTLEEKGNCRFFHVGRADDENYYRALVIFTDNFALLTLVAKDENGLRPDPDQGVMLLRREPDGC